ncbi:MAG: hypothetical protein Fur0018_12740 [Anaerolineales bacterium]
MPALALITAISIFALSGLNTVPFHPDESTHLFTSADFETLISHPAALGWQAARQDDPRQRYRLLDAPLMSLLPGLGRRATGLPALPSDWDWSRTWEENAAAGALPSSSLLTAGRAAITLLLPLTLWLLYLSGYALGGRRVGLVSVLLLGLNPLALLHARRIMGEGALLFGVSFVLWVLLAAPRRHRVWLLGLALGLAINAKQTALALLPLVLWADGRPPLAMPRLKASISRALLCLATILMLTALLNPVYGRQPAAALRDAVRLRAELAARQSADIARLTPGAWLDSPAKRLIALTGNLFIVPPQFAETGNYTAETAEAEQVYLSNPLHDWGRGLGGGAFFLALTLLGMGRAAREIWKGRAALGETRHTQNLVWLWGATALQGGALLLMIPIPWQRYVIPLLPMTVLWQAYALHPPKSKQP